MMDERRAWQTGALHQRLAKQTEYALTTGALRSIVTDYEWLVAGELKFLVRILANLARKEAALKTQKQHEQTTGKAFNPFLPYEQDLYVCDISDTHVCLLNKFNVVDHHLLIITRAFESQVTWLNAADFVALAQCLQEIDGLAFYNGGAEAGASQPHKHLQLIPLPLFAGDRASETHPSATRLPIEPAIATALTARSFPTAQAPATSFSVPTWPFAHAIAPLTLASEPNQAGKDLHQCYRQLLTALHSGDPSGQWQGKHHQAYNLLVTRNWMMIVLRSQESYESIPVNALGFAGSLLVKNAEQLAQLKEIGPLALLQQVSVNDVETR
jgi:sulfate adenylyltransferase (ADP) / ATP adenylyltransferase